MSYMKRRSRRSGRRRGLLLQDDEDPLSGVANLFDVAMIFALGLLVALLIQMQMQEAITDLDKMKEIVERGKKMEMAPTEQMVTVSGEIEESGTLYEIKQGDDSVFVLVNESAEGGG
uniref:DUF2149 domain-containing protein n=1 Tax=Candidatus Methanophaga sp. ANME-1 ERB7 TaxID=2759913 RepID=A0A7G9ZDE5_9EURY|nr:hypothetical protein BFNMBJLP_00013 [Methanosarcinales archaeon ANME-1 ERB7]